MSFLSFLVRRRWQVLGVLVLLVGLVAIFGGFARSDNPRPTFPVGEALELGRFEIEVHEARLVDADEDGEPYDDGFPRLIVDASITNISDESAGFGSDLIGFSQSDGEIKGSETVVMTLHPDLTRRLDVEIILDQQFETPDQTVELALGAQAYGWTNLVNPGPDWSVPSWSAFVTGVPFSDERTAP